jgi:hypothetical protein
VSYVIDNINSTNPAQGGPCDMNITTNDTGRKPFKSEAFSRASGPVQDTSLEARESLDEDTLSRWQREIYDYIEQANGATCWEVEQELELLHQSASPLIRRLRLKGQLVDTGQRRPTGSGRMAIVWGVAK